MKILNYRTDSLIIRVTCKIFLNLQQAAAHQQLGRQLCDLMLSKPDESYVPLLTKALTYLDITPEATLFTQQEFFDSLVRLEQVSSRAQL